MKRQVWVNLQTGEFSNSWDKLPYDRLQEHLDYCKDNPDKDYWKLIEYECLTDPDFEFYNQMKLR